MSIARGNAATSTLRQTTKQEQQKT